MSKKPKAPKKFKEGTVELWYYEPTNTFRYVVNAYGHGERRDAFSVSWHPNLASRKALLTDYDFEYLGRL